MFTRVAGLFGLGRISARKREKLEQEGIVLVEEGLSGSVLCQDFRAPGQYAALRKWGVVGWMALTRDAFHTYGNTGSLNMNVSRERWAELQCEVVKEDKLRITLDASLFMEKASGTITVSFKTPNARQWQNALRA